MKKATFLITFIFAICIIFVSCKVIPSDLPSATPMTAKTAEVLYSPNNVTTPGSTNTPTVEPTDVAATSIPATEVPTPTPTSGVPTPVPEYLVSYAGWLEWRTENPEEYRAWQQLPMPSVSDISYVIDGTGWRNSWIDTGKRFWIDENVDLTYLLPKEGRKLPFMRTVADGPQSLPEIICRLKEYNIPKQELEEYVKWLRMNRPESVFASLSSDDIDLLYSDDAEKIRERFGLPGFAFYHDGLVFAKSEIRYCLSPFDIGRMFIPEAYDKFIEEYDSLYDSDYAVSAELAKDPWEEYERIRQRDAGKITEEAAKELISGFMNLYKNLRYSPDDIAGESLKNYDAESTWSNDRCILKDSAYISRIEFSIFSFDITGYYNHIVVGQISDCTDHYYPEFRYVLSVNPMYYNGKIELFDDSYTLSDHIKIVSSDNNEACAEVTARNRDGSGETVYTVTFVKSYERWRISGGTLLDIIEPVE